MDLPSFASSDYFSYINHEKELLLLESSNSLNDVRDFLERNVFCNAIGGGFVEIIESLRPENLIEYTTCQPNAMRIERMMNELLKYVSKDNIPLEDFLAFTGYLLTLSTNQGIILPFSLTTNDDCENGQGDNDNNSGTSFSSLNGSDEEKSRCESLWSQFSEKMTSLSKTFISAFYNPNSNKENEQFGKLIEVLLLFNSPMESWKIYKESRQRCFDVKTKDIIKFTSKLDNLEVTVKNWELYSDLIVDSLKVDCRFISVLFNEVSNAKDVILNHYLDCSIDEVKNFLDKLRARLGTLSTDSPVSKRSVSLKASTPNESNEDISNNFSEIMTSAAELHPQVNGFLKNIANFKSISSIIACFARMENRIDSLLNSHWATPLGVNIDSSLSTKKPKGVLKKIRRSSRRLSTDVCEYRINADKCSMDPTQSPVFEEDMPTYIPCMEWQTMIKFMFPALCTAFEYHLTVLFEQVKLAENPKIFFIEPLNQPSPVRVSQSLQDYLKFLDGMLPIILVCYDSPVEKLLTTFHDRLKIHILKLYTDLKLIANTRQTLEALFLSLSDSIALQLIWSLFNNVFKPKFEDIGSYFFEQKKNFSDFQKMFSLQLVERCFNELVSVVLQDSKSNFWSDLKEFHENSRVGYPIQAWHLYLQKLWHSLSCICPIQVSRDVFADVLVRSLEFLVQRYASAKPSRRRLTQVRADMIAIFHVVEYFIYKIADNVEDLFGFGEDLSKIKRVHFACISLLQVVLVLCGPIELISSIHGNGYNKGMTSELKEYSNSFWMKIIKADLYKNDISNQNGMKSIDKSLSSLVTLQLFLDSAQFETTKIVELICHEDMYFVKKVLIHLSQQIIRNNEQYEQICKLYSIFYRIMSLVSEPFNCFHFVLFGVIESSKGWSEFHRDDDSRPPAWLSALYDICDPYVKIIIESIIEFKVKSSTPEIDLNSKLFADGKLPCGCDYIELSCSNEKEEEKKTFLKQITKDICTQSLHLPISILTMMAKLQEKLEERTICLLGNHTIFHVMLRTILRNLRQSKLRNYDNLWHEIMSFIEDGEAIMSRKEMVVNIINKRLDDLDINPYQEIEENRSAKTFFLSMQYNHITSTSTGLNDLKMIERFIRMNGKHLKTLMQTKHAEPFDLVVDVESNVRFEEEKEYFNPVEYFCKIGDEDFDHMRFFSQEHDWQLLVSTDIGLTEISFETILSHRWELEVVNKKEENDLSEDIVTMVNVLINKYGLSGASDLE